MASGLYTLLVLACGYAAGYLTASGKFEEKTRELVRRIRRKQPQESGPVKPMTPEEYRLEEEQPERKRLEDLVNAPPRRQG